MSLPSARKEALALGAKRYFTGEPCKRGHVAERQATSGLCFACTKTPEYRAVKNRNQRAMGKRDPQRMLRYKRESYARCEAQRKSALERARNWTAANPAARTVIRKRWRGENPWCDARSGAMYRARLAAQTPELTLEEQQRVVELYEHAHALTLAHGVPFHVDHIHPIALGGLHHPDNLQILLGSDNCSKGARI